MKRLGALTAVVAVAMALAGMNSVSLTARADSGVTSSIAGEVPQFACTPLPALRTYGIAPNGSTTAAGVNGTAEVQEYAAPKGTTLASVTLPDGFNPAQATDSTLAAFHLPPRPTEPGALAEWLDSYGHALHQTPLSSPPCMTNKNAATSNPIWSGRLSSRTSGGFTDVTGYWTQPNFVSYCLHASDRSIWDGIGGWGSSGQNKLIQAGSTTTGPGINDVSAFIEVYDLEDVINEPTPAVKTGDSFKVETTYSTSNGGTATWWFTNRTTGISHGYYQWSISGYYDGSHGEFVDERASHGSPPVPYLLRKSTNITYWSGEYLNGVQAANWTTTNLTMQDVDVLMTAVMGSTVTSSETWKDCGPGSGTNQ